MGLLIFETGCQLELLKEGGRKKKNGRCTRDGMHFPSFLIRDDGYRVRPTDRQNGEEGEGTSCSSRIQFWKVPSFHTPRRWRGKEGRRIRKRRMGGRGRGIYFAPRDQDSDPARQERDIAFFNIHGKSPEFFFSVSSWEKGRQ